MQRLLRTLIFLLLFVSVPVWADNNVSLLVDSLKNDSSFKVRAKAAEIIGKKGDVTAVSALIEALQKDENEVVRASAAGALANLVGSSGNADAYKALKSASEKDASALVKAEALKAIARFPTPSAGGYMVNDVYVELGKFTNTTKTPDPALLTEFQKLLDKQLTSTGKKLSSAPSGKKALTLDGSIKKMETKTSGTVTSITLEVSVIVSREQAFLAAFEQNASIEYDGSISASEESSGRKELLEALVPAAYSDVNKKLSRWK